MRASFFLHHEESLDKLRECFGRAVSARIATRDYTLVDTRQGKRLEIEITAKLAWKGMFQRGLPAFRLISRKYAHSSTTRPLGSRQTPYWPRGPLRISLLPPLLTQNTEAGFGSAQAISGTANNPATRRFQGFASKSSNLLARVPAIYAAHIVERDVEGCAQRRQQARPRRAESVASD